MADKHDKTDSNAWLIQLLRIFKVEHCRGLSFGDVLLLLFLLGDCGLVDYPFLFLGPLEAGKEKPELANVERQLCPRAVIC